MKKIFGRPKLFTISLILFLALSLAITNVNAQDIQPQETEKGVECRCVDGEDQCRCINENGQCTCIDEDGECACVDENGDCECIDGECVCTDDEENEDEEVVYVR